MKIVPIPDKMQKFYGTGQMLHPNAEMLTRLIRDIPVGQITTIDTLAKKLAKDYNTQVTCPMRTAHLVKTISKAYVNSDNPIPFWRVIRANHLLINSPQTDQCAELLKKEGFTLKQNSKGEYKVMDIEDRIAEL